MLKGFVVDHVWFQFLVKGMFGDERKWKERKSKERKGKKTKIVKNEMICLVVW